MECTLGIAPSSNRNVISDLGIGAILFEAAAHSAALTIEMNLVSLKDPQLKRQYGEKLETRMRELGELKSNALQIIRNRI